MRILVIEYATSGGLLERPWFAPFRAEGSAMLRCLAADVGDVPGAVVHVALDAAAIGMPLSDAVQRHGVVSDVRPRWDAIAAEVDAIWAIAPESDGILGEIAQWIEGNGRIALGCPPGAIATAASKQATVDLLSSHGIATVPTLRCAPDIDLPPSGHGWVVKPDDGVAAEGARLLATANDVRRWCAGDPTAERSVVQPFVPGTPISMSLLAQRGAAWLLACNVQDVRRCADGFVYCGGVVGGAEALRPVLAPIADAVAAALPDLWGYVGVDLVVHDDRPLVLEINPRLTTSYIGLRESIGINPAELVVRLVDRPLASLVTRLAPRPVRVTVAATA
jgi:predicted ATP-grasp superfamily ATP-dependent carboligase